MSYTPIFYEFHKKGEYMMKFIIVLSPATVLALYRLIRYFMFIHRERTILDKLTSAGVEHALVTKDQVLF